MELAVVQQKIRNKTGNDHGNSISVKGSLQGGQKLLKNSGKKKKSQKKRLQIFLLEGRGDRSKAYTQKTPDG